MSASLGATASRARRLLVGGLLGALAAGAAAVVGCGVADGAPGAAVAGGAVVAVVAFFALGQAVQVWCADLDPRLVLVAALTSYVVRVGALGGLVLGVLAQPGPWTAHRPAALGAALAAVAGWLAGEIWVYARLRIPVYDESDPND